MTSNAVSPHPLPLYLVLMVSTHTCDIQTSNAVSPPFGRNHIHCLCTLYWWSVQYTSNAVSPHPLPLYLVLMVSTCDILCSLSSSTAFVPCTDGQYTANAVSPHPLSLYLVLMVNTHPMQCCFIHCLCTLCWSVHIHVTYTHPMQSRLPSVGYTSIIKISPNISIFHISQKLKIQDYLFPNFKESKISKLDKYVPFPYFLKFKHGKLFHFQCNLTYAHSPHSQDGSD